MNSGLYFAGIIFFIAILLHGFLGVQEGFVPISDQRCGLNQPPCPFGSACINGYCAKASPPKLPHYSDLPVVP